MSGGTCIDVCESRRPAHWAMWRNLRRRARLALPGKIVPTNRHAFYEPAVSHPMVLIQTLGVFPTQKRRLAARSGRLHPHLTSIAQGGAHLLFGDVRRGILDSGEGSPDVAQHSSSAEIASGAD